MKQSYRTVVLLALAVAFAGAAGAAEPQPADKKRPPQNVGGVADAKDAGSIKGVVLFKGDKPESRPISEVSGNAFCKEHHKDKVPVRDNFVFGKNHDNDTLVNVLVYVSKGLEGKDFDPPKQPAVLDQVGCMYTPHVVGVMVGQTLEVR